MIIFSKSADITANLILILSFLNHFLKIWISVPHELITFKRLSAAMTNTVYILSHPMIRRDEPNKILLRVYGEGVEQILNRAEELDWFTQLSKAGVGPRLLATFANGRFEEYIESVTLTPSMMRAAEVSEAIALTMSQFHRLQLEDQSKVSVIWHRIETWREEARKAYNDLLIQKPGKMEILTKINEFVNESAFTKYRSFFDHLMTLNNNPIVPCHNDLQHGNILLTDTSRIVFIDYEYGGMNYAAYDIANHFCEWASDFTDDNPTPHLMNFTEKYPNSIEQVRFIRKYLGSDASDEDIFNLIELVDKFKELSHLSWALWGIIQENNSKNDFDYLGYSLMRLEAMRI